MTQSAHILSSLPKELKEILLVATVIFAFNVWEHNPAIIPNHYTDIVSIFHRDGVGRGSHGVPYVDYLFEYPAMVGAFVYITSLLAGWSTFDFNVAIVRYKLMMDLILYAFTLTAIIALYKLTLRVGSERKRIWQLFLVMPSFLMFVDYNFDIIAIAFSLLALYFLMQDKHLASAILLGLGVSAKLYPAILLPAILAALPSWKARGRYVLLAAVAFFAVNLPFMLLNIRTWFGTWLFLAGYGIENSWLIFLFPQLDTRAHYLGLAVLLYIVYKVMVETSKTKSSPDEKLLFRSFLLNLGWLLGSYIVPPQMGLILLPFYVLIPTVPFFAAYASDTLNALIIVLWFVQMSAGLNPLAADNPVQWIALGRQLVWLGLLVTALYPSGFSRLLERLLKPIGSSSDNPPSLAPQ